MSGNEKKGQNELKLVTDPDLIKQLNADEAQDGKPWEKYQGSSKESKFGGVPVNEREELQILREKELNADIGQVAAIAGGLILLIVATTIISKILKRWIDGRALIEASNCISLVIVLIGGAYGFGSFSKALMIYLPAQTLIFLFSIIHANKRGKDAQV